MIPGVLIFLGVLVFVALAPWFGWLHPKPRDDDEDPPSWIYRS
jgi:hypothetical protein